jgi:predicted NACHT family NTPase
MARGRNPVVFLSSTSEDLRPHRQAAINAAISAGFHPQAMEYFSASGRPPVVASLAKIFEADILVVIVAHRYGWVPPDQPSNQHKSVTWLECEKAVERGIEVLAFLADETVAVQAELQESYRLVEALEKGVSMPELVLEVQRNIKELRNFKGWLKQRGVCDSFTSPDDLRGKVANALMKWGGRHPDLHTPSENPFRYLEDLREQTAWIDIRGIQVGAGKAHRFPIDELYIPLATTAGPRPREELTVRRLIPLEQSLDYRRLLIVGDPGAGKTTFLRRCAFRACETFQTGSSPAFPIFIRTVDLAQHIKNSANRPDSQPTTLDSPDWFVHFLDTRGRESNWNLSSEFFREKLNSGNTLLLLDGLDEVPTRPEREVLARLLERATRTWRDCRFIVTTRPSGYAGDSVLAGFETARIEQLEPEAIETFLRRWCNALFPDSENRAESHFHELNVALRNRADIRHMAQNPVILTALAVLHWNERLLPEQRADFYGSILAWLARARTQRPGREPAERCLTLLQDLALAMLTHPEGRQVQVSSQWAAQAIAPRFREVGEGERIGQAELFLTEEALDSGIIVSRGGEVRFWHLAFQEYLAARAIASLTDARQQELLFANE